MEQYFEEFLNILSKKLNEENLKLSLSINNLDYVEKNTLLGKISIIPKNVSSLDQVKTQAQGNIKTLIMLL
jgi:hypothetical protein